MEQKIVLEKPTMEAKTILELPKGDMVKAITLLPQNEQKTVLKVTAFLTVAVGEEFFTVRPHDMVPKCATIFRSTSNALVGFAVVGGGQSDHFCRPQYFFLTEPSSSKPSSVQITGLSRTVCEGFL